MINIFILYLIKINNLLTLFYFIDSFIETSMYQHYMRYLHKGNECERVFRTAYCHNGHEFLNILPTYDYIPSLTQWMVVVINCSPQLLNKRNQWNYQQPAGRYGILKQYILFPI